MEKNITVPASDLNQEQDAIRNSGTVVVPHDFKDLGRTRFHDKYIKPLALACASLALTGCSNFYIGNPQKPNSNATHSSDNTPDKMPAPSPIITNSPSEQPATSQEIPLEAPAVPEGPTQPNSLFAKYPSWSQNFADKDARLDPTHWNVYQGTPPGNNENQFYTSNPSNLRIENGVLNLIARKQKINNDYSYTSARLDTAGKENFLYGKIDITAKVPNSVGTWPALWLLPVGSKYATEANANPKLNYLYGGEIDLLESVGSEPNVVYGVVHTLHSAQNNPGGVGDYNKITVPNNDTQFYKYGLEWTPTSIIISLNDKPYYTYKKKPGADYKTWPFDQEFSLIINLALGGAWGGMEKAKFPPYGIDDSKLPATMKIKSIDYYPYIGPMPVPKKG